MNEKPEHVMDWSIDDLPLLMRTWNCLMIAGVKTVGQLVENWTTADLLALKNFGKVSLADITAALKAVGLSLKGETPAEYRAALRRRHETIMAELQDGSCAACNGTGAEFPGNPRTEKCEECGGTGRAKL